MPFETMSAVVEESKYVEVYAVCPHCGWRSEGSMEMLPGETARVQCDASAKKKCGKVFTVTAPKGTVH